MKKKIAIIGSTGSIGSTTLDIIKSDIKNISVDLLTTNKNIKKIYNQIKKFKVKNIVIHDQKTLNKYRIFFKKKKINIFSNIEEFNKSYKKKLDYTMISITGLAGLKPTLDIIKKTKTIAIANKESIICAWNLISDELKKNKTNFIPVDSEHFSIWSILEKKNFTKNIDKIFITASGGPFLKLPIKEFDKITPKAAIKHPNWKMGKKISIDSATLMNKIFEVIEAKNIFDVKLKQIKILIHQQSYVHAMIKFINGYTKLLIHETSMKIPIFNSLFNNAKKIKTKSLDIEKLNSMNFSNVDTVKFPLTKILNEIPDNISLFETIIVSANDELVNLSLKNKIRFNDISIELLKFLKKTENQKYKLIKPKNINQIDKLSKDVRLKILSLSV